MNRGEAFLIKGWLYLVTLPFRIVLWSWGFPGGALMRYAGIKESTVRVCSIVAGIAVMNLANPNAYHPYAWMFLVVFLIGGPIYDWYKYRGVGPVGDAHGSASLRTGAEWLLSRAVHPDSSERFFLGTRPLSKEERKEIRKQRLWLSPVKRERDFIYSQHHVIVAANSGAGKSTRVMTNNAAIAANLASQIIFDPKGEIVSALKDTHDARGDNIRIIDPFNVTPFAKSSIDICAGMRAAKTSAQQIRCARALAEAMTVRTSEKDSHWDEQSVILIESLLLMSLGQSSGGHLKYVQQLLFDSELLFEELETWRRRVDDYDGTVARTASSLMTKEQKELSSVISTTQRQFRGLAVDQALLSTIDSESGVNLTLLQQSEEPVTVYVVLPPHMTSECARFLRVVFGESLRGGFESTAENSRHTLRVILDETAALGSFPLISRGLAVGRGYGIRLLLAYQSISQMSTQFGKDEFRAALANAELLAFGVNDLSTAKELEGLAGVATVAQFSKSSGESSNSESFAMGTSSNESVSATRRQLLTADEIMRLDRSTALLKTPGRSIGAINLVPYEVVLPT
jgi:type IV secretion system protein VirD4